MHWFHCGRCGSLFQAKEGEPEGRLCSKCGFDPCPGEQEIRTEPASGGAEGGGSDTHARRHKSGGRKRKGGNIMLKLFVGWSLLMVLIVLGAIKLWHQEGPPETVERIRSTPGEVQVSEEDVVFLNENTKAFVEGFSRFLASGSPEQASQFVLSPTEAVARMTRFNSQNPTIKIDPATLEAAGKTVLHMPGGKAIETRWASKDGRLIDAVFQKENGEWLLDWNHFVRFSDYPWALFLAGTGAPEGEFRLLARERLAEERKDEADISIVLYAPRFGYPEDVGFQSPEFLVSRKTRSGKLLDAAFKLARSGGRVYGSSLPDSNPDGMIRVRVMVRRIDTEDGRKFEITEVSACHWYSVDDAGVEPAEEKPAED